MTKVYIIQDAVTKEYYCVDGDWIRGSHGFSVAFLFKFVPTPSIENEEIFKGRLLEIKELYKI